MRFKKKKGFTLVELLIVMAIIGVLAAIGIPSAMSAIKSAKETAIIGNIKQLENGSMIHHVREGDWPLGSSKDLSGSRSDVLFSKSGKIASLPRGEFYAINYETLSTSIKEPKDGFNYVIQNPEGNVYYLEGLGSGTGSNGQGTGGEGSDGVTPEEEDPDAQTPSGDNQMVKPKPNEEKDFVIGVITKSITGYRGESRDVVIPDTIGGKSVTALYDRVFNGSGIKSVVIPSSVTNIGSWAFSNNPDLTQITIGDGVKFGIDDTTRQFKAFYEKNGKIAGTFIYDSTTKQWIEK